MAQTQDWKGKTNGGAFGQRFLLRTLRHVPTRAFYPVLYPIIPFCLLFARKTNRAIYLYYRKIWGLSRWKAFTGNVKTAFVFGRVVIDKFALWAGNKAQFKITIREEDSALVDRMLDQEKGFILAGSHIGNFELMGQALEQDRKPFNCIIFGGESQLLQERRNTIFQENNVKLIPVTEDMSHLFAIKEALDHGEVVAILCDRMFTGNKKKSVDFLGHPADFPTGIFRIATLMEVPVISAFMLKDKNNRYHSHLVPLDSNSSDDLLLQYVHSLEEVLHTYPEQWFNFFDFWKTQDN